MQTVFDNRIFDLFVQNTFSVMSNDVLVAVPLFLFMGYVVERANIVDRLFSTLYIAARGLPGAMAVAALITCALFATVITSYSIHYTKLYEPAGGRFRKGASSPTVPATRTDWTSRTARRNRRRGSQSSR